MLKVFLGWRSGLILESSLVRFRLKISQFLMYRLLGMFHGKTSHEIRLVNMVKFELEDD